MSRILRCGSMAGWLLLATLAGSKCILAQEGQSPSGAAPVGMVVDGIVECGDGYNSHELYDVKITILETVRGQKAWGLIQAADKSNPPAGPGSEYVLARIKFSYIARGAPGDCNHGLKSRQFIALSKSGTKYEAASAVPPKPVLGGSLHAGDTAEGWVPFLVPLADKKPLMTFSVDDTGAEQHGGDMWFQLY
jgi:hypothetical protein